MTPTSDVVVTGLGVVGPFGLGRGALLAGLRAGVPRRVEVDRSAGHHRPGGARFVSPVTVDLTTLLPAGAARRMSPPARLMVAAAKLALADAGLAEWTEHPGTGIVSATAYGPTWVTERLLEQIFRLGPESASPALFTESVASASAAQTALALQARGPNQTITQREASDLVALAEGARLVRNHRAERVLVGVVEDQVPILHALLDRFGALAKATAELEELPRPFDRRRNGFLVAEGATVLVLEPDAAAARRGARPLARCLANVGAFDPSAPAHAHGEGARVLAEALRRGLGRAGVDPGAIDLVVSGASGSVRGDRLEALTLRALFGAALPPVFAPKGTTGEYGGTHLAAAVLAASGASVGATAGFAELDPELGIVPLTAPLASPARTVLVSSLAAGGAAAWAVLGAPDKTS